MDVPALSMVGITKSFDGVAVLKGINLSVRSGEVHALLGENGAGKSTLMKILMGIHQPDSGRYLVSGEPSNFKSPVDAQRNRVSMVYQEFGLVRYLSATENILMGRLPTKWGAIDWQKARALACQTLEKLGSKVSPDAIVGGLKVADQQEVEIARALSYDPLIFVMDEPSAALSRVEIENLYNLVKILRRSGVAIVYISHKLEEVFDLADRVTILRDGRVVGTHVTSDLNMSSVVEKMTGCAPATMRTSERQADASGEVLIEIKNLTLRPSFEDISLTVQKGRVVGIAGVIGAGKSELARTIVGAIGGSHHVYGSIVFDGHEIDPNFMNPNKARKLGIGFVSEDRQAEGIVHGHTVGFNTMLPALNRVSTGFALIANKIRRVVDLAIKEVRLRPPDPAKLADTLSGGNQQKVVIAKWLAAQSSFIILDEPTRGIDVGARQEIYDLLRDQAVERGTGVLLMSSDMREILVACDEIVVMVKGRITRRMLSHQVTEHELLELTLGQDNTAPALGAAI